jgi:precorrin-3B synthase
MLATREWAPALARSLPQTQDGSVHWHVSGCTKGCAHPTAAALTLTGPDLLVVNGRASDAPHGSLTPSHLIAGVSALYEQLQHSRRPHERDADVLLRLGHARAIAALGGQGDHA